MATWVPPNPVTTTLLNESLEIDARIKAAYDAANPGQLSPTQAVVSNTQVINITAGGTVTLTVAGNAITGAVYTAP